MASRRLSSSAPFRRLPFDALPERPRVPHGYHDASSEDVVVDSEAFGALRTRVVTHGRQTAPPVLLVHGLMTSSYSWRYLLEPLGSGYRVYAPDLPGCGRSEARPERRHSAAALGSFIGDLQQRLGITGCAVVGNSLGGYLCMQRALRQPQSFSRVVAIHPPAVPQLRLRALHLALKARGAAWALSRALRRDPLRWAHRNVHYHDETLKSLEEARTYGEPLATAAGAESFIRYLTDALDPREMALYVGELERRHQRGQRFPVPLKLVYAREDPVVAPENGPKLHGLIPDAELRWLEDSSHFAQVDSPGPLAAMLSDFLEPE
ncbi:MAG: alpha/beta fold hydrolase [Solirubrobacterales bacterium]